MITLHIDLGQRDQIVQALRELADRLESPFCPERATNPNEPSIDVNAAADADVDDLRDMADLIEDVEDGS